MLAKFWTHLATRFRIYRMTRALDAGHLALAQLRRTRITCIEDLLLRSELAAVITAGEIALARMKESA